jgi:signal transduction histidine kinase
MRGIYNLYKLKFDGDAPIIRKIFGTLVSSCFVLNIISVVCFLAIMKSHFPQTEILFILKIVGLIWCCVLCFLIFILYYLLKNTLSPLTHMITWAKDSQSLEAIELPNNLSEEVQILFEMMNDSICRLKQFQAQTIESEKNAAIARTTQMLAHDVRQPFSLLRITLSLLSGTQNVEEMTSLLKKIEPEVERSLLKVNAMLSDIMEIDAGYENLNLEPKSLKEILFCALCDTIRTYPKSDVHFHFDFLHQHRVFMNSAKMERVIFNLLGNAIQAMKFEGNIWINTKEMKNQQGQSSLLICIGNDHSYIPQEELQNLFKAFYTKGKKHGMGLGLAIAEKVIQSHGGSLWCVSEKNETIPEGKVEFCFTLPLAIGDKDLWDVTFPKHSFEFLASDSVLREQTKQKEKLKEQTDWEIEKRERQLDALFQKSTSSLSILIVDDDVAYRNVLKEMMKSLRIHSQLNIEEAPDPQVALQEAKNKKFHLIFSDVDLQGCASAGFELIPKLKNLQNLQTFVCVHSNRFFSQDYHKALESGADVFIPKPLAKGQLIQLFIQCLEQQTLY